MRGRFSWRCFMNETPFRIALVVVIVLTMVVTVYHRLQAAKSGEKISHKDEGYLFVEQLSLPRHLS